MIKITDPDLLKLAQLSSKMRSEYPNKSEIWVGSPFEWIRSLSPRKKGSVAEKFLSYWLEEIGFTVEKTGDSDADLLVNSKRIEIKFSTLWDSGVYTFQQLRDQNYDFVLCFGLSPLDAHCWLLPKKEVLYQWNLQDGIVPQHRGATGKDTAWLSFTPNDAPKWMENYGGQLTNSKEILKRYLS